ncbi:aminodeoxychorismate synthase component I [Cetobacterium sp. SF1]|uniref:aminodeoxychorismate synthase component I n=1 Tax=Cetobacterium sp. SF1 TaxID=3417654 RepID=UPI003CEED88D
MLIKEFKTSKNSIEIFENFLEDDYAIFLDSQRDEKKLGRYSIIASNPFIKIISKNQQVTIIYVEQNKKEIITTTSSLSELSNLLEKYKISYDGDFPFIGGALGHFSYDLLEEIEKINISQEDDLNIPDFNFGIYNEAIVIDNLFNKKYIIAQSFVNNIDERIKNIENKICQKKIFKNIFYDKNSKIENCIEKEEYIKAIEIVKENIEMGNVYQINYTQRFQCQLNKSPFTLYKRLGETNKAPFASYLSLEEYQIVSSSPERFIRVQNRKIDTRPIKGTIARGKTEIEDFNNKNILKNSKKDQSELLMIVDLERNDLGKICKTGSVKVDELFHIEEYATVFQQIANVEGILKDNIDLKEILQGTFPGGSITGAPKIKAMELIGKLEKTKRNIYTGSIGYISFNGNIDFNIVIRTVLCKNNMAYFQVGGGIVWDSDAEAEYEESLLKGKALKEALLWKE